MSQREYMTVDVPCIICNGVMQTWHYSRDDETGEQENTVVQVDQHLPLCEGYRVKRNSAMSWSGD